MRIAAISDIHGNIRALRAILDDCRGRGIDRYLFLGDYYGEFPLHNEVLATVAGMPSAYAIQGNKEERFLRCLHDGEDTWTSAQLAPLYWSIRRTSPENRAFIRSLPDKLSFTHAGTAFYLAHAPKQHFGRGLINRINGQSFFRQHGTEYTGRDEYLRHTQAALDADPPTADTLSRLPDGVYLFGHYHTQWHARVGRKLLINPGSCGLPLDLDPAAPYTILDAAENGVAVTERRVAYDREAALQEWMSSDCLSAAPFWNELARREFVSARIHVLPFLEFAEALAQKRGDNARPYSNTLWREAIALYPDTGG